MRKLALALVLLSGCQLIYGQDDKDAGPGPCDGRDYGAIAPLELRNPYTGECLYDSGNPPPGCADPVPTNGGADQWIDWRWPTCYSPCDGLPEAQCRIADGCRAIYASDPRADEAPSFAACWGTAQDGPVRGGDCTAITDAFECSQHDDCIAVHAQYDDRQISEFLACWNESDRPTPGECSSSEQCGPGYRCNAADICLPPPGCEAGGPCDDVCYGVCVPVIPGDLCTGSEQCGDGYHCNADEICLPGPGCDPATGMDCPLVCYGQCVPNDPQDVCWSDAECSAEEFCNRDACAPPPDCGVNGDCPPVCYGVCTPRQGGQAPACGALDEAACVDRTDGCHDFTSPGGACGDICSPSYVGDGCSCQGDVCECTTWTFTSCDLAWGPE